MESRRDELGRLDWHPLQRSSGLERRADQDHRGYQSTADRLEPLPAGRAQPDHHDGDLEALHEAALEGRRQGHSVPATATAFPRQLFSKTLVIFVGRLGHAAVVPHRRTCPRLPETEQYHPGEKFEGTGRNQGGPLPTIRAATATSPTALPAPARAFAPAGDPTDHKHHRKDLDQLDQGSYKGPDEDHPTQKRFSTMKRDSAHQITDPDHIPIALST